MVNGFRQHSVSFVYRSYHLPMPDYESIYADSLNSNFLQLGRDWQPATAGSSPPSGYTCQHCDTHYFSRPRGSNPQPSDRWLIVGPTRYQ